MGLPKQIRKQIKQNEEIETYIRGTDENPNAADVAAKAAQDEIDNLLNEVEAPKDPDAKPPADVTELHPKPEGGDPETPPAAEPKPERIDWKQKYSVLKGKYDAEVPRLSQDVRDANSRITNLEDKITGLATQTIVEEPAASRTDFTPEEVADYGEDLLDVIGRKARMIVETEYLPQMNKLNSEVSTLRTQLGETGQKVGKFETNEVFAQLDATVKDWRTINTDPVFHEWLDQTDPYSGQTRKDLMLNAFNRKNAHQVRAFFNGFMQENAAVVTPSADPQPSGQGGTQGSTLNLGDYIAPGTPKSGGDIGAPKEKRIWTNKEIGAFYSSVQKGHYKGRPDDKVRIEADIVAATREGRIKS